MAVNEKLVQDVVREVVAKLQINADVSGSKGVFTDMNAAIEAAKQAQKKVQTMSMDQREKIITIIKRKTKENDRNPCTYGSTGNRHGKCRA